MRIGVVGGGPAGALAAYHLARAGMSVRLFDPSHPREKPCGGGLTGRAIALVSDVIDLSKLNPVIARSAIVEEPELVRLKADATSTKADLQVASGFSRTSCAH